MVASIHKGYVLTFHFSDRTSTHDWQPIKTLKTHLNAKRMLSAFTLLTQTQSNLPHFLQLLHVYRQPRSIMSAITSSAKTQQYTKEAMYFDYNFHYKYWFRCRHKNFQIFVNKKLSRLKYYTAYENTPQILYYFSPDIKFSTCIEKWTANIYYTSQVSPMKVPRYKLLLLLICL